MEHEYRDGLEVKNRFDKLATASFRVPKSIVKPDSKPVRTPKEISKG